MPSLGTQATALAIESAKWCTLTPEYDREFQIPCARTPSARTNRGVGPSKMSCRLDRLQGLAPLARVNRRVGAAHGTQPMAGFQRSCAEDVRGLRTLVG